MRRFVARRAQRHVARKTKISGSEFELRVRNTRLPKFQQSTGRFDLNKKITATVIEIAKAGGEKPIVCGFLCSHPEAERRFGLSAKLKGKKRHWVSFQTALDEGAPGKYSREMVSKAMAKASDEIRAIARRQGIEILLVWPGTSYGERLASKRGYKKIPGTPVLMKQLIV